VAELVERTQALGQLHRAVQCADERRAADPDPVGACCRVGHHLDRAQMRHRAEQLLAGPRAVEAEIFGADELSPQRPRVEGAVGDVLRDGDGVPHDLTVDLVARSPTPST